MGKPGRLRYWNRTRYPNRKIRPVVRATGFTVRDVDAVTEAGNDRLAIALGGELRNVIISVKLDREEELACGF